MRPRLLATSACVCVAVVVPLACVDLFHSTDFETLHDAGPAIGTDVTEQDVVTDAGPKPIVDFCAWTPAQAKDHAMHACAWLGACGGPLGETAFGPCMLHALWAYDCELNPGLRPNGATRASWSCLSDVKSCADVAACLEPGGSSSCSAVASGAFTKCGSSPTNDLRVECGRSQAGPPSGIEPCALVGRTCSTIDDSTSLCTGATKATCAAGLSCLGTGAVDCQVVGTSLVDLGIDCAAFGSGACASDDAGSGAVACVPGADAGACDAGTAVTCDEDIAFVARSCVAGRAISVDCSKLGVSCDVTTKPVPAYDPLQACAERVDAGRCSGADECLDGKLRSCAQGIAFDADCASLGLGACTAINGGALAHCTF